MKTLLLSRLIVIVIFGVIVPVIILFQAYQGTSYLSKNLPYTDTPDDLVKTFSAAKLSINNANDYALFSLLYTEHANQKTMINKQIMKVSVMQIGFSVISIGMMLIVLGINAGGIEGVGEANGIKFDIKIGSTGIAVFLVGSVMATVGGVLKNDYTTGQIPKYVFESSTKEHETIARYKQCKEQKEVNFERCFLASYEKINAESIK